MTGCSQGTVREGARGGRAEFSWDQVRTDEHRENYLGHSILAPTGRWQKGRDITWYNKNEQKDSDEAQTSALEARRKELLSIKQKEEEEMNRRLGKKVDVPGIPVIGSALLHGSDKKATDDLDRLETGVSKDDRRAARKLAKQQVREQRRDEHRPRKEERRRDRERSYSRRSVSDDDRHSRSPRGVGGMLPTPMQRETLSVKIADDGKSTTKIAVIRGTATDTTARADEQRASAMKPSREFLQKKVVGSIATMTIIRRHDGLPL